MTISLTACVRAASPKVSQVFKVSKGTYTHRHMLRTGKGWYEEHGRPYMAAVRSRRSSLAMWAGCIWWETRHGEAKTPEQFDALSEFLSIVEFRLERHGAIYGSARPVLLALKDAIANES